MKKIQSEQHRSQHVLVVDDEKMIQDIMARFIKTLGHTVTVVDTGNDAIDEYKKSTLNCKKYDIVIVDLNLDDGINGLDTVNKLREIDPDIKAVVTSGYSNEDVVENFRSFGFSGVLPKPFTLNELKNVLNPAKLSLK